MAKGNNRVRTKIASHLLTAELENIDRDRRGLWLDSNVFVHLQHWSTLDERCTDGPDEDEIAAEKYERERYLAWATGGEYPNEVYSWRNEFDDSYWDYHDRDRDLYEKWHPDVPILTVATCELYYFNTDIWHIRKGYDVVGVITKHPFDWEVTYHPMIVGSAQEQYTFDVMEASLESLTQFVYMMATLEGEQRYV